MQVQINKAIGKKMAENLRHIIAEYYESQTEVAKHWGISQGTVSRIWRKVSFPRPTGLTSLLNALDITKEELQRSDFEEFYRIEKSESLKKSILLCRQKRGKKHTGKKHGGLRIAVGKKAKQEEQKSSSRVAALTVVAQALGLHVTVLKGGVHISEPG